MADTENKGTPSPPQRPAPPAKSDGPTTQAPQGASKPPATTEDKPQAAVGAPGSSSQDINVNPAPGEHVQSPAAAAPEVGAPQATRDMIEAQPAGFTSPAVHTDSRTSFYKQKIAELERQAIEAEQLEGTRRLQAKAQIRAQIRELRERENRRFSGADPRTPRGSILHAEEAISKRPEFHYRFININAPGKADNAKALGYEKVPEDEGGKTLGDLALFRIPFERRAERVAGQEKETQDKIKRFSDDMKGEVREMAKFLRRRGVDINENRLGIFSDGSEED
jgi:hypothetical protein